MIRITIAVLVILILWTSSYSPRQMADLVITVGHYRMVSMALKSFGVQLEPGLAGFSEPQ